MVLGESRRVVWVMSGTWMGSTCTLPNLCDDDNENLQSSSQSKLLRFDCFVPASASVCGDEKPFCSFTLKCTQKTPSLPVSQPQIHIIDLETIAQKPYDVSVWQSRWIKDRGLGTPIVIAEGANRQTPAIFIGTINGAAAEPRRSVVVERPSYQSVDRLEDDRALDSSALLQILTSFAWWRAERKWEEIDRSG